MQAPLRVDRQKQILAGIALLDQVMSRRGKAATWPNRDLAKPRLGQVESGRFSASCAMAAETPLRHHAAPQQRSTFR
jgi:hypothetical protein